MNYVAFFVGALLITFLLIRGLSWLLRKVGQEYLGLAHALVAVVGTLVAAYGLADGGEPQFAAAAVTYVAACLVWFLVDFYRLRHR